MCLINVNYPELMGVEVGDKAGREGCGNSPMQDQFHGARRKQQPAVCQKEGKAAVIAGPGHGCIVFPGLLSPLASGLWDGGVSAGSRQEELAAARAWARIFLPGGLSTGGVEATEERKQHTGMAEVLSLKTKGDW